MRTPQEMIDLILDVAQKDDLIRAVLLSGSRANVDSQADIYQDFDITYVVKDVKPYWDNENWICEKFSKPSLMQKPESMKLIAPDNNGNFVYLMVFPDGNRIDLSITKHIETSSGEPMITLLDKDHLYSDVKVSRDYWYVKKPTQKMFGDCCNEFCWCLNNIAKGIARDELTYTMKMLNIVNDMLLIMLGWYVGVNNDFSVSVGKYCKYLKKYLPTTLYQKLENTYPTANVNSLWNSTYALIDLFSEVAKVVSVKLGLQYNQEEEQAIRTYLNQVKNNQLKY